MIYHDFNINVMLYTITYSSISILHTFGLPIDAILAGGADDWGGCDLSFPAAPGPTARAHAISGSLFRASEPTWSPEVGNIKACRAIIKVF